MLIVIDEAHNICAAEPDNPVGVISTEAPPQLAEEADLFADGPAGWLAMLETLAE